MKPAYIIQAAALDALLWMFAVLPPKMASTLGGEILATLGSVFTAQNRRIDKHLKLAFPAKTPTERKTIAKGMWRHLGMILGEYPHLGKFMDGHPDFVVESRGLEHLSGTENRACAFVSAHVGNWEILPIMCAKHGVPFHAVYRAPNNPLVAARLEEMRSAGKRLPEAFPKSREGLKNIAETLKKGEKMGFLIDQRHSGGPEVPFFGHPAQTTTVSMDLALKYDAIVMPGRILRRGPCDFLFEVCPPLATEGRSGLDLTADAYRLFEEWIAEAPEQWLWTHRRWGKHV